MENFSTFLAMDRPVPFSASSSVAAPNDDVLEDSCSICLEPFTSQNPATITTCKHEYHIQCILEWLQRSKECPICWQSVTLKDPKGQELLDAAEEERSRRSQISTMFPATNSSFQEYSGIGHDVSFYDDSEFDECLMRHLAVMAMKAHYVNRREQERFDGVDQFMDVFDFPSNSRRLQHPYETTADKSQDEAFDSSDVDSPGSPMQICFNSQLPVPTPPTNVNRASSSTASRSSLFKRSHLPGSSRQKPEGSCSAENISISETLKSKFSSASARYKESISKGTRSLKEKIISHNTSVKELSRGVHREMTAGIDRVARIIESLDLNSKKSGTSGCASSHDREILNSSINVKDTKEDVVAQSPGRKGRH